MYSFYLHGLFLNFLYKILKHKIFFFNFFRWLGALAGSVSFKIQACNWPRVNQPTLRVNPKLGWPDKNPIEIFFFSNVFFLLPRDPYFFIFFSWLPTHFKVHYINTIRKFYFCNACGIWSPLVYILYVHKKKVMFFFHVG
jgi:hypothetical protein